MKSKENKIPVNKNEIEKFKHAKYIIRAYNNHDDLVGEEVGTNRIGLSDSSYMQRTVIDDAIVVTKDTVVTLIELWYATNKKPYELLGMRRFPGFKMAGGDSLSISFDLEISWIDNELVVTT